MNNNINQFWYNGNLISQEEINLSVYDTGFLYGATVFTTLRIYNNNLDHPLTQWKAHGDRLINSLKTFNWDYPNWEKIRAGAEILKEQFPILRITIFADGRELIIGRNLSPNLKENQLQGITAWLGNDPLFRRDLPHHKTGNYLGAWLALQKALKLGAKEAILLNDQNHWIETATGNLWGYKEGFWYTPPLEEGILSGITRNHLLNTLEKHNYPFKIVPWTAEFTNNLEIIAYSNCAVEIMPIKQILTDHNILKYDPFHCALDQLRCGFK
jgi:4-amino-4-deoxychorismate lyase